MAVQWHLTIVKIHVFPKLSVGFGMSLDHHLVALQGPWGPTGEDLAVVRPLKAQKRRFGRWWAIPSFSGQIGTLFYFPRAPLQPWRCFST